MDYHASGHRSAPLAMSPDAFRAAGHRLVDQIADFLTSLPRRPVSPGKSPRTVRRILGDLPLADEGMQAEQLLDESADLLFNHSTFNGHPQVDTHPELQAFTHNLSITTFRYVPVDLDDEGEEAESYLNDLNTELLERLHDSGEAFVSNVVIEGKFVLRACVVNFRTTLADIEALPGIVARIGREADSEMRPAGSMR